MTMTDFLDYPGASTEKKITSSQVIRFSTHVTETQSSSKENLKLSVSFFFSYSSRDKYFRKSKSKCNSLDYRITVKPESISSSISHVDVQAFLEPGRGPSGRIEIKFRILELQGTLSINCIQEHIFLPSLKRLVFLCLKIL